MTNGLVKYITVEESTIIQRVKMASSSESKQKRESFPFSFAPNIWTDRLNQIVDCRPRSNGMRTRFFIRTSVTIVRPSIKRCFAVLLNFWQVWKHPKCLLPFQERKKVIVFKFLFIMLLATKLVHFFFFLFTLSLSLSLSLYLSLSHSLSLSLSISLSHSHTHSLSHSLSLYLSLSVSLSLSLSLSLSQGTKTACRLSV